MNRSVVHIGYGLPLICPSCREKGNYYGMLKVPGNKSAPCPNCGTPLISMKRYAVAIHPSPGVEHDRK
jgi:hypothetical protein